MSKKTIRDIDIMGKKVLVRCDFNVPLDKQTGEITDDTRIRAALPTIKYLIDNKAKIILISHLGRPKGEIKKEYSLEPVAKRLEELLNIKIKFATDIIGESAKKLTSNLEEGEIVLLENVRFDSREEKNDEEFSKELASMAEIFVNDAFGTAHRAHSSTEGVSKYLSSVSGFLIEKELKFLGEALQDPKRPFTAILGGAKVSDKIAVIENLLNEVDNLLIGGGMAYTFLKAQGYEIGDSLCEEDKIELAKELLLKSEQKGVKLVLPIDTNVAKDFSNDAENKIVDINNIKAGWQGLDIGPKTMEKFTEIINNSKTVIWNGPLGVNEFSKFIIGTEIVAKALADSDAVTIIGGGDSASAIEKLGLADKMTHISTGGGASLEFLEGKALPGIECLMDKEERHFAL